MFATLISSSTAASNQASFTFSSIPQIYTDLIVVLTARSTHTATDNVTLTLNATNTALTYGEGTGTAASAGATANIIAKLPGTDSTASVFGNTQIVISNYTSSAKKIVSVDYVCETNAAANRIGMGAGVNNDTTATSTIVLATSTGLFAQYSSAYLYGLTKGTGAATVTSA